MRPNNLDNKQAALTPPRGRWQRERLAQGRWRRVLLIALVSVYAVLWVGGVAEHFSARGMPAEHNWLAAPFLFIAGLIIIVSARLPVELAMLLGVAVTGYLVEWCGVRFAVPFGAYQYTDALWPRLFGVPLVMSSAWMILFAYVQQMLLRLPLRLPSWSEVTVAALWMTTLDLLIDPLAANELGYWRWSVQGGYYGIPALNFLGWFATSLIIFSLFRRKVKPHLTAASMGLSIALFFTLVAVAHELYGPALIGGALCLSSGILLVRRPPAAIR